MNHGYLQSQSELKEFISEWDFRLVEFARRCKCGYGYNRLGEISDYFSRSSVSFQVMWINVLSQH